MVRNVLEESAIGACSYIQGYSGRKEPIVFVSITIIIYLLLAPQYFKKSLFKMFLIWQIDTPTPNMGHI